MRAIDDANCGMLFSNPLSDLVDVRREAGEGTVLPMPVGRPERVG